MKQYSTKEITKAMMKTFAILSTPRCMDSDNGPPFTSTEFADFAEIEGFYHYRVTPEHPRANGEAESFTEKLKKPRTDYAFTALRLGNSISQHAYSLQINISPNYRSDTLHSIAKKANKNKNKHHKYRTRYPEPGDR